jgi:hypothetical protein
VEFIAQTCTVVPRLRRAGGTVNRRLLAHGGVGGGTGLSYAATSPRPLLLVVTTTESTPVVSDEQEL